MSCYQTLRFSLMFYGFVLNKISTSSYFRTNQYNVGTHKPIKTCTFPQLWHVHSNPCKLTPTTKGSNTQQHQLQHSYGRKAWRTLTTAHTYITQHSTEYCKAFQCASHTPDYEPISKLLDKDENAALANLGMRTVATPADGHCLLHAFIRRKEIKYGNSDPCNERENKLLELIKSS